MTRISVDSEMTFEESASQEGCSYCAGYNKLGSIDWMFVVIEGERVGKHIRLCEKHTLLFEEYHPDLISIYGKLEKMSLTESQEWVKVNPLKWVCFCPACRQESS